MSDGGWRPGDGRGPDMQLAPPQSSRSVPVYVLFLIMLGSGIFTLVFLWICVQCIYHKRRVRRARADIERNNSAASAFAAAPQAPWEAAGPSAPLPKDGEADIKRCDAGDAELTYVVMAGEDQPTFLARPLKNPEDSSPVSSSPPELHSDAHDHANPDKISAS